MLAASRVDPDLRSDAVVSEDLRVSVADLAADLCVEKAALSELLSFTACDNLLDPASVSELLRSLE